MTVRYIEGRWYLSNVTIADIWMKNKLQAMIIAFRVGLQWPMN